MEATRMANFRWTRGWIAMLATLAVVSILIGVALAQRTQPQQTDLSTTLAYIHTDIANHHVDTITIDNSSLTLDRGGGVIVQTGIGQGFSLSETLKSNG